VQRERDVVLAFSGGLDTSYCVVHLREQGWRVTTLFVDTGGVGAAQESAIAERARTLGAHRHVASDGRDEVWREVVVPMVMGGATYQNQYPLLCGDRYVIARHAVRLAQESGAAAVAHGCTAMGNDQVRFDHSIRALSDLPIVAPIRDLQSHHRAVRAYEIDFLQERGFDVPATTKRYTINQNMLGATLSGAEIDAFAAPGDETRVLTSAPARWPREPLQVKVGFEQGVPVALDGADLSGPALLQRLNESLGRHGFGRGLYTGDTTIGLKGRIVFECPGLAGLLVAHRALEEVVLSRQQNAFKPLAARQWVQLVYEGLFFEPLRADLEALLRSSQRCVSGEVTLDVCGGSCLAVGITTPHALVARGATYAQEADWSAEHAEGFIRLFGQSAALAHRRAAHGTHESHPAAAEVSEDLAPSCLA
jgi:argininosuccinate synthase